MEMEGSQRKEGRGLPRQNRHPPRVSGLMFSQPVAGVRAPLGSVSARITGVSPAGESAHVGP